MTTRREQLEELAKVLAKATKEPDVKKIELVLFKFFSLVEKRPTDTFARNIMSKL